ncbi:MAG: sigma-70 family RNA polymerase sigma factor [Acidobacteriota bacterium]
MDQDHAASPDGEPTEVSPGHQDDEPEVAARRQRIEQAVDDFQHGIERDRRFKYLFDTFYEPTRSFLAKRVSSPEDCLDLTQETFLRVYRGLEGYRGEAQFGTWVFRIAFNTYLKWLRRLKAEEKSSESSRASEDLESAWEDDEMVAVSPDASPLERILQTERHEVLRQAIHELPEQMRRCTELRIYHDLSYREIAVVMRRSIETVKVHLFQARKKLKESFGDVEL